MEFKVSPWRGEAGNATIPLSVQGEVTEGIGKTRDRDLLVFNYEVNNCVCTLNAWT